MTKATIVSALKKSSKNAFVSRADIAEMLGYEDPHAVDKYISGLDRIGTRYLIDEVADVLAGEITSTD